MTSAYEGVEVTGDPTLALAEGPGRTVQSLVENPMLSAALSYGRQGFRVFPLKNSPTADLQKPAESGWQTTATTDGTQITRWWTAQPQAGIGIATDPGLVVLDVDPRKGGRETLEALVAEHGPLPATPTVLSGGGGWHYYFRGTLPDKTGLFPGIDLIGVFATGSPHYVVAPPSPHPSGGIYAWADGHGLYLPRGEVLWWIVEERMRAAVCLPHAKSRTAVDVGQQPDGVVPVGRRREAIKTEMARLRWQGAEYEQLLFAGFAFRDQHCQNPPHDPFDDEEIAGLARHFARQETNAQRVDRWVEWCGGLGLFEGRRGESMRKTVDGIAFIAKRAMMDELLQPGWARLVEECDLDRKTLKRCVPALVGAGVLTMQHVHGEAYRLKLEQPANVQKFTPFPGPGSERSRGKGVMFETNDRMGGVRTALRIYQALSTRSMNVAEIEVQTGLSRSTIYHWLGFLRGMDTPLAKPVGRGKWAKIPRSPDELRRIIGIMRHKHDQRFMARRRKHAQERADRDRALRERYGPLEASTSGRSLVLVGTGGR
jgi:prepilin-type processing-associated H-X9-DG protein